MARSDAQTKQFSTTLFLISTISVLSGTGCARLITPDAEAVEPAQRVARLEELYRVDEVQQVEAETAAIVRWVQAHVYGAAADRIEPFAHEIIKQALRYDLDPMLVAAVIKVESYYNPDVISYAGAVGLMQVIPYVGKDVAQRHGIRWDGWQTLLDPKRNIAIGAAYLRYLIDRFEGDTRLALAAYNMGPTLLMQRLKYGFTPNGPYVSKVISTLREMRGTELAKQHLRHLTQS